MLEPWTNKTTPRSIEWQLSGPSCFRFWQCRHAAAVHLQQCAVRSAESSGVLGCCHLGIALAKDGGTWLGELECLLHSWHGVQPVKPGL
jgi:hypothetical protein